MPNKPITQGYKIFGVADHRYLYNFIWSSREKGLQDILLRPNLTKTGCLVRTLALSLPRRHLAIYIDNYFTSIPLFAELRACKFGAIGTTRPHRQLPSKFRELKERYASRLDWNTLLADVIDNTLYLAWQDNNIVLALSNIHTVHKRDDFRERIRRRQQRVLPTDESYVKYSKMNRQKSSKYLDLSMIIITIWEVSILQINSGNHTRLIDLRKGLGGPSFTG